MVLTNVGVRFEDRAELPESIRSAMDSFTEAQLDPDGVRKPYDELPWREQLGSRFLEQGDAWFLPDEVVPPEIAARARGAFGPTVGTVGCLVGIVAGPIAAITIGLLVLKEAARKSTDAWRMAIVAGLAAVLGFWAMRRAHRAAREEERLAKRLPFRTGLYLLPEALVVFNGSTGYLCVPPDAVTRVFVARFGSFDRTQLEYREPDGGARVAILGGKEIAPRVQAWRGRS